MLTVPEAAVRVGRNPETVRRWIRSGRLSATRIGTQFLIDEAKLEALTGRSGAVRERGAPYGAIGEHPGQGTLDSTIQVALDAAHTARLLELARRIHLSPESVARSLLSTALDQRAPDATAITGVLDTIPGAFGRAQRGLEETQRGQAIPLEDL